MRHPATLQFPDQCSSHLSNMIIGAGINAVADFYLSYFKSYPFVSHLPFVDDDICLDMQPVSSYKETGCVRSLYVIEEKQELFVFFKSADENNPGCYAIVACPDQQSMDFYDKYKAAASKVANNIFYRSLTGNLKSKKIKVQTFEPTHFGQDFTENTLPKIIGSLQKKHKWIIFISWKTGNR